MVHSGPRLPSYGNLESNPNISVKISRISMKYSANVNIGLLAWIIWMIYDIRDYPILERLQPGTFNVSSKYDFKEGGFLTYF